MNSHTAGSSAPKFASFKPKPSSTPTITSKEEQPHRKREDDGEQHREEKRRHRSRSPNKEKKRHRRDWSRTRPRERHSRSRSPRRDRSREFHARVRSRDRKSKHDHELMHRQSRTKTPEPVITPWDDHNRVFIPDKTGDKYILTYGSLHRGDVSRYRRTGCGYVLGLPQDFRIDRDRSDEKRVILKSRFGDNTDGSSSGSMLRLVRPAPAEDARAILPESLQNHIDDLTLDYMQLNPRRKRKRGSVSPIPTAEEVDYRSIEGRAKESLVDEDSDFEYASSGSDNEEGADTKARTIELSRHVKAEPQSLKAWGELIAHQEAVLRLNGQGLTSNARLSAAEARSLAGIRLSIYNDALNKITNGKERENLLLEMMAEAELVWEESRLEEKWEDILRDQPNSALLWNGYLDHVQADFKNFTFTRCLGVFKRCLRILSKAPPKPETVEMQTYIFLRVTVFIRESGFIELAIALWQAMLELHLFKTPYPTDKAEQLKRFEEFWDAEVPRISEDGARGWTGYATAGGEPVDPITITTSVTITSKNCFKQFAEAEPHIGQKLRWPGRAADETGDDPYHMIMFSDIQEWLEVLPLEIPIEILMHAFLALNGLPPLALASIGDTRKWWTDSFLDCSYLDMEYHATMTAAKGESDEYELWNGIMTPARLFEGGFPPRLTDDPELTSWIYRILDSFRNAAPQNEAFAEYYLAYTARYYPGAASKTGKALLKANQTSLRLYNAYALAERKIGKISKADSVYAAALSMAHNLPQQAQTDIPIAWFSYAWTAMESNNTDVAYKRTVLGPDALNMSGEVKSSSTLKARRTFTEGFKNNLSQNPVQAIYYLALLALLTYLQGLNISTALDVLQISADEINNSVRQHSAGEKEQSTQQELLCQFKAQLLKFYTERHAFKPDLLRRNLQHDISLFPENTNLLDLWKFNEAKFGIEDRLRGSLSVITASKDASFFRLLWDVQRETDRREAGSGTMHSVSASFERAVSSRGGKNSVTIWRQYVLFLWRTKNMDEAKTVLLRGLTHLPWAKGFLMLAFSHLRNVFSDGELKGLYNVLHEKELRVHVDLSGVFDEIDAGQRKLAERTR